MPNGGVALLLVHGRPVPRAGPALSEGEPGTASAPDVVVAGEGVAEPAEALAEAESPLPGSRAKSSVAVSPA